ncbi:helix-turn-helix transcriptional regulator [Microbacterium fluvii]|uniref:Helix-turn-helix transcriptional regulator n=1 Tax=Microbacterium fluvii TaxID=415215 RepID=A0ABW2H9N7_9MICO|nr:winged helix-turn-helix transcriptional regulator [Microbacterium fluvii]MCU4671654.1 winged helix-turn-helix transcriptional regulator [Microbacterium fluvii]
MTRLAYSALSSYSRVQIMRLVQDHPGRTITDLCDETGLHANTVREHVQRLIEGGYLVAETERRTTRGRPRVLYSAATGEAAASSPIARRKAEEAARRGDLMRRVLPWTADAELPSDALHQIDALVEDLGDAGFDPIIDEGALTVDLSPCPHASADGSHRDVLCAVHQGLMEGVLTQAGGPLRIAQITTSCDPSTCVVMLRR